MRLPWKVYVISNEATEHIKELTDKYFSGGAKVHLLCCVLFKEREKDTLYQISFIFLRL